MALDIKPTRSELINLKRRIKQTSSGYNLLKMKRDGLFHEFRTLLSEMIAAREELVGTFRDALQAINLASSIEGGLSVKSAAIAASKHPEVQVSRRNIMGVVVPKVEGHNLKLSAEDRGLGMVGGSPYIDEAADAYSLLVEKVVKAAEMEATLKRLLEEIEATKRRVNALECKVIPERRRPSSNLDLKRWRGRRPSASSASRISELDKSRGQI